MSLAAFIAQSIMDKRGENAVAFVETGCAIVMGTVTSIEDVNIRKIFLKREGAG